MTKCTTHAFKLKFMIRKNSGDGACIVCLEASPAPIQSGCACRGDSGLAHIDCLVRVAASQQAQRGTELWWLCQTCKQPFTGAMQAGLAEAWPNHRLPRMSGFIHPHAFTNLGGFVMCPKCGRTPADVQAAPLEEKLCLAPNPSGAEAPPRIAASGGGANPNAPAAPASGDNVPDAAPVPVADEHVPPRITYDDTSKVLLVPALLCTRAFHCVSTPMSCVLPLCAAGLRAARAQRPRRAHAVPVV